VEKWLQVLFEEVASRRLFGFELCYYPAIGQDAKGGRKWTAAYSRPIVACERSTGGYSETLLFGTDPAGLVGLVADSLGLVGPLSDEPGADIEGLLGRVAPLFDLNPKLFPAYFRLGLERQDLEEGPLWTARIGGSLEPLAFEPKVASGSDLQGVLLRLFELCGGGD